MTIELERTDEVEEDTPSFSNIYYDPALSAWVCQVDGCDKSYPTRNGLQGHMLSHKPPVNCEICGREFKAASALGNHRRQTHGIPGPQSKTSVKVKVPEWHTDDIFESVVKSLWPGGHIPTQHILALVQWREATQELLKLVQDE